jgi:hypothetical protein
MKLLPQHDSGAVALWNNGGAGITPTTALTAIHTEITEIYVLRRLMCHLSND